MKPRLIVASAVRAATTALAVPIGLISPHAGEMVEAYEKTRGFTDADIAKFRSIMLED